jgi:hypothetical protein
MRREFWDSDTKVTQLGPNDATPHSGSGNFFLYPFFIVTYLFIIGSSMTRQRHATTDSVGIGKLGPNDATRRFGLRYVLFIYFIILIYIHYSVNLHTTAHRDDDSQLVLQIRHAYMLINNIYLI